MKNKFIYTDDPSLIEKLIKSGYKLIKTNDKIYVFENKPDVKFQYVENKRLIFSDVMIF